MTEHKKPTIAIIGAGVTGMSAAWDLVRAGYEVTIYEAGQTVGGLAGGFREARWDWSVEKFYHHWFQSDAHLLGLLDELGLRANALFPRPYTVIYHNDRWYPFDSIPHALAFPGLGWGLDKVRFGLVGLYLRLTKNWQALERFSAHEWMRRWAGVRAYETMWEPMLEGKFGPYYKQVNMAWFWARIHARTTRLGTYRGGFQQFLDDFAERLRTQGVRIHLNCPVTRIVPDAAGGLSLRVDGQPRQYDRVLSTTSPSLMADLTPDLPPDYLQGLRSLKSLGAVVLVLSIKQRLSEQGYYWFNIPKSAGFPFLALVEHTNFLPPEHFNGEHILYCGDYLPADHEYFRMSPAELQARFVPAIQRINPRFSADWINQTWLFREPYAQPVPFINHSRNIPALQTPLPGLYFASMSHVYPWDRGTNFAVELGRRVAGLIQADGLPAR
ncbi:MAG: NAD(P)/FAD-dependent oxidoreductase [Anaerolineales bacterium]